MRQLLNIFRMKLFEKIGCKFAGGATDKVRTEVKKTALDLIPSILGIGSMILGFVIFRGVANNTSEMKIKPSVSNTSVTTNTNNYFFNEMSEETIQKILGDD